MKIYQIYENDDQQKDISNTPIQQRLNRFYERQKYHHDWRTLSDAAVAYFKHTVFHITEEDRKYLESLIVSSPKACYFYANDILSAPFEKCETFIFNTTYVWDYVWLLEKYICKIKTLPSSYLKKLLSNEDFIKVDDGKSYENFIKLYFKDTPKMVEIWLKYANHQRNK